MPDTGSDYVDPLNQVKFGNDKVNIGEKLCQ